MEHNLSPQMSLWYRLGEYRTQSLRVKYPVDVEILTAAVTKAGHGPSLNVPSIYTGLAPDDLVKETHDQTFFVWVADAMLVLCAAQSRIAFTVVDGWAIPITAVGLKTMQEGGLAMHGEWSMRINALFGTGEVFTTDRARAELLLQQIHHPAP